MGNAVKISPSEPEDQRGGRGCDHGAEGGREEKKWRKRHWDEWGSEGEREGQSGLWKGSLN